MRNLAVSSNVLCDFGRKTFFLTGTAVVAIFIFALLVVLDSRISFAQTASQKSDIEKPLKNTDVTTMSKAGFGDDIVIAKINQAPREELDVSVEGLIGLKKKGVSKAVIEAMIKRVDKRTRQPTIAAPDNGPPATKVKPAGVSDQPACVANFETEGGFVKGETKKSFRDYPEIDSWESVFGGILRSVTTGGWQISSSDKEAGTISGVANVRNIIEDVRQFFGVEVTKLTLNVLLKKKESGGIRVETALLIPAGTKLPDKEAQTVFCRILVPITPGKEIGEVDSK